MPKAADRTLVPGTISRQRAVPGSIARPEYVGRPAPAQHVGGDKYDDETIGRIRAASKLAAQALELVLSEAKPGVTTDFLDQIGHEFLCDSGAYPSTLGYRGYPKSLCTSLNEVICHGIPDDTVMEDGDIVNVDISAYLDGVHGDTNGTVIIGQADSEVELLVERTKEAMMRGIRAAKPGREVNIIGRAIETYAKRFNYGVVRDFTGHGVGTSFHSGLIIPHYDEPAYRDIIEPGMVFTVEPMLTLGSQDWDMWNDDWTVTTKDKSFTAQFEHTVLITESGAEILTEA
ncbi:MAG: type I methionyl aminopeptidase [Micrococcales bacterium]|jgi:methionyl aminopeptidase|nr:type I methionyl aminopeptidase [Micrococcales bacterium]